MLRRVIVRSRDFFKKYYLSRFDFKIDHLIKGKALEIGNIGGIHGKGASYSTYAEIKKYLGPGNVYGFDLFDPPQSDAHIYTNQSKGDINNGLPYPDDYFDNVLLGQVLEHLQRPIDALKEIHRVTKKTGVFIVDVPNPYSLKRMLKYFFGRYEDLGDETHLIFYTPASLKAVLIESGFEIKVLSTKMQRTFLGIPVLKWNWFIGLGTHLMAVASPSKSDQ